MKRQTKNDIKEFLAQQKLNAIVFFLLVALVCFFVKYIKYNDVKDVISTLQSISAAIFTIVGLWGACPENCVNAYIPITC